MDKPRWWWSARRKREWEAEQAFKRATAEHDLYMERLRAAVAVRTAERLGLGGVAHRVVLTPAGRGILPRGTWGHVGHRDPFHVPGSGYGKSCHTSDTSPGWGSSGSSSDSESYSSGSDGGGGGGE